jgi:hypothetical protein
MVESLGHDRHCMGERSDARQLVGCRLLHVVDDEDVDGCLGRFQSESELLLDSREDRRTVRIDWWG